MKPNDFLFMKWADDVSECSTCAKIHVGAVLVKDTRVISIGYNGVVSNAKHCNEVFSPADTLKEGFLREHAVFSEQNELHAEQNAILDALKRLQAVQGATIYTTYSPCFGCSKVIISTGITRVVYRYLYKQEAVDFLRKNDIIVEEYEGDL